MYREVIILTTAFIVAATAIAPVPPPSDGPLQPPLPPASGDGLDVVVSPPLDNTDSLMVSEEEIDFHYNNMLTGRKGCSPTKSCVRAGGHCVKSSSDCDGKLDKKGCKGGKKCRCCIPDQTTPSTPTCSPTTCPPSQTCPVCPTCSEAPTIPKPSPDQQCPRDVVHADQYSVCPERSGRNWTQAVDYCTDLSLSLAQPKDLLNLCTKLIEARVLGWYWIGGKGSGSHQTWTNGSVVNPSHSVWMSGYPGSRTTTSDCLVLQCRSSYVRSGQVLMTKPCSTWNGHVICD